MALALASWVEPSGNRGTQAMFAYASKSGGPHDLRRESRKDPPGERPETLPAVEHPVPDRHARYRGTGLRRDRIHQHALRRANAGRRTQPKRFRPDRKSTRLNSSHANIS